LTHILKTWYFSITSKTSFCRRIRKISKTISRSKMWVWGGRWGLAWQIRWLSWLTRSYTWLGLLLRSVKLMKWLIWPKSCRLLRRRKNNQRVPISLIRMIIIGFLGYLLFRTRILLVRRKWPSCLKSMISRFLLKERRLTNWIRLSLILLMKTSDYRYSSLKIRLTMKLEINSLITAQENSLYSSWTFFRSQDRRVL